LHKGEVIEEGSHRKLMKQEGVYHKLYELQFSLPSLGLSLRSNSQ